MLKISKEIQYFMSLVHFLCPWCTKDSLAVFRRTGYLYVCSPMSYVGLFGWKVKPLIVYCWIMHIQSQGFVTIFCYGFSRVVSRGIQKNRHKPLWFSFTVSDNLKYIQYLKNVDFFFGTTDNFHFIFNQSFHYSGTDSCRSSSYQSHSANSPIHDMTC